MKSITISGIIGWDTTAQDLREALHSANGDDVEITISSPGGLVFTGLEMFNLVRNYSGHTTARLSGYAMSMASYIPLAANKIVAEDNAIYMIHNVRGGVFGDHNEILKYGAATKGMSGLIMKAYAKRSGKSLAEVEKMMDAETYLYGDEMVEQGFVDEIITTETDKDADTAKALACVALQDCNGRMSADMTAVKKDLASASLLIGAMTAQSKPSKGEIMNLEKLKAEHPDLYQAVFTAGKQSAMDGSGGPMCGTCACAACTCGAGECATCTTKPGATALATARTEGAAGERARIAAVRATLIPGHEALVESLAFDGTSTAADAALAIIGAEKQLRIGAGGVLDAEAPPLVPVVDTDAEGQAKTMKRGDFNKLPLVEQAAAAKTHKIVE